MGHERKQIQKSKSDENGAVILTSNSSLTLPAVISEAGPRAEKRFFEFFTVNIRNENTRFAYLRAVKRFFLWCEKNKIALGQIEPILVAAYVEQFSKEMSAPTVKQHLAAIRMCFDWLVVGQIIPMNPASAVRGPKHVSRRGKTPVLPPEDFQLNYCATPLRRADVTGTS